LNKVEKLQGVTFNWKEQDIANLKEDIGEQNDISENEPTIREKLRALLHSWRNDVSAQMPQQNTNYESNPNVYPPKALEGGLKWDGFEMK